MSELRRFAAINLNDVDQMVVYSVPENTSTSTNQWMKVLNAFIDESDQLERLPETNSFLSNQQVTVIEETLSQFILAARKVDGDEYKANSLKVGLFAINRKLKAMYDYDFLASNGKVTKVLDAKMKDLQMLVALIGNAPSSFETLP